jgi:hypothetical protein
MRDASLQDFLPERGCALMTSCHREDIDPRSLTMRQEQREDKFA